jgi:hypothetical protein
LSNWNQLVYFMAIWYYMWSFGLFSPVLVCCTKKNLASLLCSREATNLNH